MQGRPECHAEMNGMDVCGWMKWNKAVSIRCTGAITMMWAEAESDLASTDWQMMHMTTEKIGHRQARVQQTDCIE